VRTGLNVANIVILFRLTSRTKLGNSFTKPSDFFLCICS